MGRHLSPRYGQVIRSAAQRIPCFLKLSIDHRIDVSAISVCSWALKLARKCEIKRWSPCGADGRLLVRAVYGHVIAKFSRMGRFSQLWGSARAELRYNV